MDYGRLSRKELQALCKQHGIPANKTNVFMAEALGARLNNPVSEQASEPIPDPAEIVMEKAKRTTRPRRVKEVEAGEVDDLSFQLAKSTLTPESSELPPCVETKAFLRCEAPCPMAEAVISDPSERGQESEILPEAVEVEVPRKSRSQSSRASHKSINSLVYSAPAPPEPTVEMAQVDEPIESLASAVEDFAAEPLPKSQSGIMYSRRRVVKDVQPVHEETEDETAAVIACVLSSEADTLPKEDLIPAEEEEELAEETTVAARAVTKKSTAKGKRSKKGKAIPQISVDILEDEFVPPTNDTVCVAGQQFPDSPTFGVACDAPIITATAVSLSPTREDGFEFKPVPESFTEIMTKPVVEAGKGCQHRIGRRSGKACKSCASENKVNSLIKEVQVLQAFVNKAPIIAGEPKKIDIVVTPVKQDEDKENSIKNLDLQSLSIRKLQKEVRRRGGLSKRNNSRSVAGEILQQ